jgi:hypothetical protein
VFSDALAVMRNITNFRMKKTVEPFFACNYTGKEIKTEVVPDGKIDQTLFIPVAQP